MSGEAGFSLRSGTGAEKKREVEGLDARGEWFEERRRLEGEIDEPELHPADACLLLGERPAVVHLNAQGAQIFSTDLAHRLAEQLPRLSASPFHPGS